MEFLTQKGKYVPIPLDKAATVVSTKGMFFERGRDRRAAGVPRLGAEDR